MQTQNDQQTLEQKWYTFWEDNGLFKADPKSLKPHYGLLMPPPNLTGELHMGHAMQHSLLDAIARFKRMQGFDVLLQPGVDHAGIQFESTLNKRLSKEGISKYQLGREKWLERAWQFKDEVYKSFRRNWTIFGISADWSREVFTLGPEMQRAVLKEFQTFWDQDLLYKGAYIVQWCPKDMTAIEDVEMEYEERKEKLYFVNYKVEGTEKNITIATARPETIPADVAIAVYPQHPKYSQFVGKNAQNPLTGELIPIIEDDRVEKEFGTGALKITPGHDLLDYQIGQKHNLSIKHAVSKEGKVTDIYPELAGLKVAEAREKAADLLQQKGAIEKIEEYTHSVPVCERCKTTVEPLISEEWFVKMKPLAEKALKHLEKINFVPESYQHIISEWLDNIHDWSISRSLWWGHRIPVWYCQRCNPNKLVGKDKDMIISLEHPLQNCQTCKLNEWVQDEQVLDTWFSSGLWPMATLGWPEETAQFKAYYPWGFELTSPEIRYLWISRMIMLGLWFVDDIPFKNMFFHGTLRDLQGRKMSKSLGNGIEPLELINQWGTDPVRMALYSYSAPGRDPKASRQTMDERCKNFRNFGTKLRNITRFIIELKPEGVTNVDESHIVEIMKKIQDLADNNNQEFEKYMTDFTDAHPEDKTILRELLVTTNRVTRHLEEFNLHLATEMLYEFVWHRFADQYIEHTKTRRAETQPILELVLKDSLKILHPFMPFITEELWEKVPHEGISIMTAEWPKEYEKI